MDEIDAAYATFEAQQIAAGKVCGSCELFTLFTDGEGRCQFHDITTECGKTCRHWTEKAEGIGAVCMRTREQLLEQWDDIRAKIAGGCTNDGPRLWFEGVIDDFVGELDEAHRIARQWRDVVAVNIEKAKR